MAVVVDNGGGIGIEVLNMINMDIDFVVGIASSGITGYIDIHEGIMNVLLPIVCGLVSR